MSMATTTRMDEATLLRLTAWLSPAFPTAAFSYSGGLEAFDGDVGEWCETSLGHGALRNDVVLCAITLRGEDVVDLARALASCSSRLGETEEQGAAFLRAVADWDAALVGNIELCPLPVAVGRVCAALPHRAVLTAYAQSGLANAVAAAQRLGRIGQRGGVQLLSRLEPQVLRLAREAANGLPLAQATFNAEIAAMRHETLPSRIHRS